MPVVNTSIEEGHETIHPAFEKFFDTIMNHIYENEDQMENNLMKANWKDSCMHEGG